MNQDKEQTTCFREASRALKCDDDEARFDEKLNRIAKPQKAKEEMSDAS